MDGGHNTLAIAVFFVERLFDKKIKDWEECKEFWDENYDDIVEKFQKNEVNLPNFSIPVEVIYPTEDEGALDQYYNFISEICEARNNNVELTEASKGNQVGLYTDLKKNLDGFFDVIWKSGDSGKIKSEEVISMATIPLLLLQENELLPADIGQLNPISIYSQKGKCVDFFNAVMEHKHISDKENGKHVLNDSYIKSGLALVQDILRFFDKVYVEFPRLYNKLSPGVGRMKSVDDKKAKLATFRTSTCDYSYPPAFMYPLIAGVTELIEIDYDAKELRWKKSPMSINLEKLDLAQYIEGIKLANYDPQKVGKQGLFYGLSKTIFKDYLSKN
jgi:hypothetical protein